MPVLSYREVVTAPIKELSISKPYITSKRLYRVTESGIFWDPIKEEYVRPYEGDWGTPK